MCDTTPERTVISRAKQKHTCQECTTAISKGERYVTETRRYKGQTNHTVNCMSCWHTINKAFKELSLIGYTPSYFLEDVRAYLSRYRSRYGVPYALSPVLRIGVEGIEARLERALMQAEK